MEGAAIAMVAKMLGVPMIALKVVTDIVDTPHPTEDEFLANLASAAASLQKAGTRLHSTGTTRINC
eukprot:8940245-Prorocentrum_lima.AAC.1